MIVTNAVTGKARASSQVHRAAGRWPCASSRTSGRPGLLRRDSRVPDQHNSTCVGVAPLIPHLRATACHLLSLRHNARDRARTIIVSDIASRQHALYQASSSSMYYVKGYVASPSTGWAYGHGDHTRIEGRQHGTTPGPAACSARRRSNVVRPVRFRPVFHRVPRRLRPCDRRRVQVAGRSSIYQ
jgi:hypothetical protein